MQKPDKKIVLIVLVVTYVIASFVYFIFTNNAQQNNAAVKSPQDRTLHLAKLDPVSIVKPDDETSRQRIDTKLGQVISPSSLCTEVGDMSKQQTYSLKKIDQAMLATSEKFSARLAQSAMPAEQAMSLYLDATNLKEHATLAYESEHPACAANSDCSSHIDTKSAASIEANTIALVRQATTSNDPDVYALAYALCRSSSSASCSQISAEMWRSLAPTQLAPLIAIAREATTKGDQALYLALQKVAEFKTDITPQAAEYFAFKMADFQTLSAEEKTLLEYKFFTAGAYDFAIMPITKYCKNSQYNDVNRRQLCTNLAEKLTRDSGAILDRKGGARIGKDLGWSQDKLAKLDSDNARLRHEVQAHALAEDGNSCKAFNDFGQYVHQIVVHGEIAATAR